MADLQTFLKNAERDAKEAQRNVDTLHVVDEKIASYDDRVKRAIVNFVEKYPDSTTKGIENIASELEDYTSQIADTTLRLQQKVEHAKSTLALFDKSAKSGYNDLTSKRLLLDYAEQYKQAYIVVCAKAALFVVVLSFIFTWRNVFLTAATSAAVVIVWYTWHFVLSFFTGRRPRGGDTTKGKLCPDGTASDATGSNCSTCPEKAAVAVGYTSCAKTPFGCCPNGRPSNDADGSGCGPPLACASTQYGCCPDGISHRTDASGSQCDWTDYRKSCTNTEFGCCPNGATKIDDEGSNCTNASACGKTAFGCCTDGKPRIDFAGSNCA